MPCSIWHKPLKPVIRVTRQVWFILADLTQHGCHAQATYFRTHQRRMTYQTFREQGFPIGSGAVESAIKQFKQRLTAAGMRWSRPGIERMIAIRTAILSHTFFDLWQQAA
jgi:hypothetical protein